MTTVLQVVMNRTASGSTGSLMSHSSQFSPGSRQFQSENGATSSSGEVFDGSAELALAGSLAGLTRITHIDVAYGDFVFALRVAYNNGKTLRHGEAPLDGRKLVWTQKWKRLTSDYAPSRFEKMKWKGFSLSKVRSPASSAFETLVQCCWVLSVKQQH
jgi:hypothetical protein